MSHFTVLTVHKDGEDPEELLAPFQENNMGDCPEEYMEFELEFTKEQAEEERLRKIKEIEEKLAKGEFKKPEDISEYDKGKPGDQIYGTDLYLKRKLKEYKAMTAEEFIKDCHGYEWDEDHQGFGYMHNPNSKWDWYQMGGRWTGYFKPKKGAKSGVLGDRGAFGTPPEDPSYVDQIRFDEIDFEGMAEDELVRAKKLWKEYKAKVKSGDKNVGFLYGIEKGMTRKAYIEKRMANGGWQPFAFIDKDGEWHEVGSMGWWGIVSDEDRAGHENNFAEFVKTLEPDDILTIWDCHI